MTQTVLSRFDAGDLDDKNLSVDTLERRREVREYAPEAGGWEVCVVTDDGVSWWNPDGPGVFRLRREGGRWRGVHGGQSVGLSEGDLQDALDAVGDWLAANPVDG